MPLTMQQAKEIWEPHQNRITNVVQRAWQEFKTIQDCRIEHDLSPLLYSRTKSNDIFDAIARNAFEEFGIDDKFQLKIQTQTFKLFHGGCCIRFKKGGANLLGKNIPTQAALNFADAETLLPEMPPHTAKLEVIWRANEFFTELESIHIVSRDGERLVWEYQIDGEASDNIVDLPINSVDPDDETVELIRPKKDRHDTKHVQE